jgi:hypothetical protein
MDFLAMIYYNSYNSSISSIVYFEWNIVIQKP